MVRCFVECVPVGTYLVFFFTVKRGQHVSGRKATEVRCHSRYFASGRVPSTGLVAVDVHPDHLAGVGFVCEVALFSVPLYCRLRRKSTCTAYA